MLILLCSWNVIFYDHIYFTCDVMWSFEDESEDENVDEEDENEEIDIV